MPSNLVVEELKQFLHRFQSEQPLYLIHPNYPIDPYEYKSAIVDFVRFAYDHQWVSPDYRSIEPAWLGAPDKKQFITGLDEKSVLHLIAWHIRGDRFCSGMLASALDDGYLQAAIGRLIELSD
jgi:hypothetical protein